MLRRAKWTGGILIVPFLLGIAACGGELPEEGKSYSPTHHAAEGIVSDDIWTMVDDLLTEMDSPHLLLDFDQMTMDDTVTTTLTVDTSVADDIVAMLEAATQGNLEITQTTLPGGTTTIVIVERVGAQNGY